MHVIQKKFGPNYFVWSALKVPPSDFIQNMSQAPSKCLKQRIKVDKTHHSIWKLLFVLGADEYLERLEGKIRECLFFYIKYSKITVCKVNQKDFLTSFFWSSDFLAIKHYFEESLYVLSFVQKIYEKLKQIF